MNKDILHELADYLAEHYNNVTIRKNKIIVLEQSDPYIIRIKNNKATIRRWWDNLYLLSIVALLLYSALELVLTIFSIHTTQQVKLLVWLIMMTVSILLIARDNKCQKQIKAGLLDHVNDFLARYQQSDD